MSRTGDYGFSVPQGPSIMQRLAEDGIERTRQYLERKRPESPPSTVERDARLRGEIHGIALSLARMMAPYRDPAKVARKIEREWIEEAKT